jgi:uncharacterized protein YqgV (UPF0045/DUF77 family)
MLGYTFALDTQQEAEKLVKYFRGKDISARIEPVSVSELAVEISGTYGNLRSYLLYCRDRVQRRSEDEHGSGKEGLDQEDEGADDESDLLCDLDETLQVLADYDNDARQLLEGKQVGDVVFSFGNDSSDHVQDKEMQFDLLLRQKALIAKGVLNLEDDGKVVVEKIVPFDELIYSISPIDEFLPSDEEAVSYNLTKYLMFTGDVDYHVHVGPEYLIKVELLELMHKLKEYDLSEFAYEHAVQSFFAKREIVEHIIHVMDEVGVETVDQLLAAVEEMQEEVFEEKRKRYIYEVSADYVKEILEDLKKLDIVRLKGNKIKLIR